MSNVDGQRRRASDLKRRIESVEENYLPRCTVPDPRTGSICGRPTARAARQGLSVFTCKIHQQFAQRHGSHWCKSPSAVTLKPYLTAAMSFIGAQRTDPFISA